MDGSVILIGGVDLPAVKWVEWWAPGKEKSEVDVWSPKLSTKDLIFYLVDLYALMSNAVGFWA